MRAHVRYQRSYYADIAVRSVAELRRLAKRGSSQALVGLGRRGIYSGRWRFHSGPYPPPQPRPPTPSANGCLAPNVSVADTWRKHQEHLREQDAHIGASYSPGA